jgi:hypothetical protein
LEKYEIKKTRVYPLQRQGNWKINIIEEISLTKNNLLEIDFNHDDLEMILNFICTG